MVDILLGQFKEHLQAHYPDYALALQANNLFSRYLDDCRGFVTPYVNTLIQQGADQSTILKLGIEAMAQSLGPSKYDYLQSIVATKFGTWADKLREAGILQYEIMNLITLCEPIMESYGFDYLDSPHGQFEKQIVVAILEYRLSK
ncbi:hypothetical protein [Chitinophaga arvensicola]|uniref:Uncharacterized protein n=1 Tax=Chitinophaga arvensicola TaxID=29529 RepID=A0A1I0PP88_9BACT|nr:hypothetical protein [Chitinophaga arvensicola]SEW16075.1 hypothetical protein SAMN04488122_0890 [Chitinophaga arvensicola]